MKLLGVQVTSRQERNAALCVLIHEAAHAVVSEVIGSGCPGAIRKRY